MAWKSFYLAAGMVKAAALPFYRGAEGAAHIPPGACLIAANHSSFFDGPLLALAYAEARHAPLHMIAYEEPFAHWAFGWFLRSARAIPFRRGDRTSQAKMLRTALGWLAAGEAVGIFPEAHINQKSVLARPRPGAALLALESGAPVVPAAVTGTATGAKRRVTIRFGRPVPLLEKERRYAALPRDERKILVKNLGYRIMRAIGELSGRECAE